LNGFFGLSVTQLVLLIVIGGVATVYALIKLSEKRPATDEPVVAYVRYILLPSGEEVLGWTSLADKLLRNVAFTTKLTTGTNIRLDQFELISKYCHAYGVRDEATSAIGDKTLMFSTMPIGIGSPYCKVIHAERPLVLGGRPYNYLLVEGYGERAGKFEDWNVAWVIPRDLSNPTGALGTPDPKAFEQYNKMCKLLGEAATHSRRAARNISEIEAAKQQVEDRTATVDKLVKENLSLRDQVNTLKTILSKKPLHELPEVAVEAVGKGNILWYIIVAVVGYFAGTNISQTFMEPQQLGFIGFIAAPAALYYFYFRRKAAPRV